MWLAKYGSGNCSNIFYEDADDDGYGNLNVSTIACTAPAGYVADSTDCDDANPEVHPGGIEIGGNGIDEDCDGEDGKATGITSIYSETFISLYPNPAITSFVISLSLDNSVNEIADIEIVNSLGQIVQSEKAGVKNGKLMKEIFFGNSIADGIYTLKVIVKDQMLTQSLIHLK